MRLSPGYADPAWLDILLTDLDCRGVLEDSLFLLDLPPASKVFIVSALEC